MSEFGFIPSSPDSRGRSAGPMECASLRSPMKSLEIPGMLPRPTRQRSPSTMIDPPG